MKFIFKNISINYLSRKEKEFLDKYQYERHSLSYQILKLKINWHMSELKKIFAVIVNTQDLDITIFRSIMMYFGLVRIKKIDQIRKITFDLIKYVRENETHREISIVKKFLDKTILIITLSQKVIKKEFSLSNIFLTIRE